MKLGILIEWEIQRVGNGKMAMGARGHWEGQEIVMSSTAFDPTIQAEFDRAQDQVFDPILEKLGEKLREGKV